VRDRRQAHLGGAVMTTREELDLYFAIRALVWNNKLATLDAKTVASVVKTLRAVREDVRAQLLEAAGNITDWNAERMARDTMGNGTDTGVKSLARFINNSEQKI
jgi:hypothetical protein